MLADKYYDVICEKLNKIKNTQREIISKVSGLICDATIRESIIYIFGSGHSHILAEDCFYRAGGFANVSAILYEPLMLHEGAVNSSSLERQPNMAEKILDPYPLKEGDIMFVISNSGINNVPIDCAIYAKSLGASVIAITSMQHSSSVESRHQSGLKLYQVADFVIDNFCEKGDTALYINEEVSVAPISTICGSFILHSLFAEAASELVEKNIIPPVYISANTEKGKKHNSLIIEKYGKRIKHL